jgi:hypothetical protein
LSCGLKVSVPFVLTQDSRCLFLSLKTIVGVPFTLMQKEQKDQGLLRRNSLGFVGFTENNLPIPAQRIE